MPSPELCAYPSACNVHTCWQNVVQGAEQQDAWGPASGTHRHATHRHTPHKTARRDWPFCLFKGESACVSR